MPVRHVASQRRGIPFMQIKPQTPWFVCLIESNQGQPQHKPKTHYSNHDLLLCFSRNKLCMPEDKVSV